MYRPVFCLRPDPRQGRAHPPRKAAFSLFSYTRTSRRRCCTSCRCRCAPACSCRIRRRIALVALHLGLDRGPTMVPWLSAGRRRRRLRWRPASAGPPPDQPPLSSAVASRMPPCKHHQFLRHRACADSRSSEICLSTSSDRDAALSVGVLTLDTPSSSPRPRSSNAAPSGFTCARSVRSR